MSFTTQIPVKSYIKAYLENNYGSPCDLTMLRRFGWQLSKTDTIRFNQRCEAFIKFYSRQFIMANNALGIPVSECIREFQHLYNFSEDSFSYETIKKDFDRHGSNIKVKFIRDYREQLKNIFLGNLSTFGTIHKSLKNE